MCERWLAFKNSSVWFTDKKQAGKSKDEALREKERELNERLQDVTGKLGSAKKRKGKNPFAICMLFNQEMAGCLSLAIY